MINWKHNRGLKILGFLYIIPTASFIIMALFSSTVSTDFFFPQSLLGKLFLSIFYIYNYIIKIFIWLVEVAGIFHIGGSVIKRKNLDSVDKTLFIISTIFLLISAVLVFLIFLATWQQFNNFNIQR